MHAFLLRPWTCRWRGYHETDLLIAILEVSALAWNRLWRGQAQPKNGLFIFLTVFDLALWANVAMSTVLTILAASRLPKPGARAAATLTM